MVNMKRELEILKLAMEGIVIADDDGCVYVRKFDSVKSKYVYTPIRATYKLQRHNQYINIAFTHDGERYRMPAHRLVWMYFNKSLIPMDMIIHHKDGIKFNNSIVNLECTDSSGNNIERYRANGQ